MGTLLVKKDAEYWGISLEHLARNRLNGTRFLGLMQEAIGPYRTETWNLVDEWARRLSWTDKKAFKTVVQFGALETKHRTTVVILEQSCTGCGDLEKAPCVLFCPVPDCIVPVERSAASVER